MRYSEYIIHFVACFMPCPGFSLDLLVLMVPLVVEKVVVGSLKMVDE